jgi:hypothetical protein
MTDTKRATLLGPLAVLGFLLIMTCRGELPLGYEQKLAAGDREAIEQITQHRSLEDLYGIFMLGFRNQLGERSIEIKDRAAAAIRKMPGHAKHYGDKIESLSNKQATAGERAKYFHIMAHIATDEAIAQTGRFIFDERTPDKDIPVTSGMFISYNSTLAANALGQVLGDLPGLNRKYGFYGSAETKAWQQWWQSPAADRYKNPALLDPLSVVQRKSVAEPSSKSKVTEKVEAVEETSSWSAWLVILAIATILFGLYFSRKPRP